MEVSNDKTLVLFLRGILEAVDHVNHGKHQAEDTSIHKCHATATSTNSWGPRVVKINTFLLITTIGTHPKNELVQVIAHGLDFLSQKGIQYLLSFRYILPRFRLRTQIDHLILGILMIC